MFLPFLFAMFGDLFAYLPVKVIQVCTARLQGADPVLFLDFGGGAAGDVVVHVLDPPLRNEFPGSLVHYFPECLLPLDGVRGVRESGKLSLSKLFESRPISFCKVYKDFVFRLVGDGNVCSDFCNDW